MNFTSRGECCYPLLPFGLSSPVQNVLSFSQNAGLTPYLCKSFKYRTHIIERRTVLTEIPARFTPPKILSAGAPRGGIRRSHTYARVCLGDI